MTLLPCANCGNSANIKSGMNSDAYWFAEINCDVCPASMYVTVLPTKVDCEEQAIAAWNRRAVPEGFVLVPVESARVCATLAKLHFDRVQRHFAVDDKFPLSENWQPHINALLDAVEQEKKNG